MYRISPVSPVVPMPSSSSYKRPKDQSSVKVLTNKEEACEGFEEVLKRALSSSSNHVK